MRGARTLHKRNGRMAMTTPRSAAAAAFAMFVVAGAQAGTLPSGVNLLGSASTEDPLMIAADSELTASNAHDLSGFLRAFAPQAVILVDAPPYSYHGEKALAEFFRQNLLGSRVQYTIKPGAPQTEDRVGDHAYLELIVNVRATDPKGDSFNDPIHWIAALVRTQGSWK